MNKELIKKSGLDVYLVCFNNAIFNQVYPFLKDMVDEINGSIIDTK